MSKPSVLFVCVHNAGRSQMAAAFLSHLSAGAVEVRSAGSAPADQVNPAALQAMAEVGIDIAAEKPKILTDQAVRDSDVVITMGCDDTCPFYPGKRYEDWVLDDPAGRMWRPSGPSATTSDAASRRCSTTSFPQATTRNRPIGSGSKIGTQTER